MNLPELYLINEDLGNWDRSKIAIIKGDEVTYDYMSFNPDFEKTDIMKRICNWLGISLDYLGDGFPYCIHGDYQPRGKWPIRHFWRKVDKTDYDKRLEKWSRKNGNGSDICPDCNSDDCLRGNGQPQGVK